MNPEYRELILNLSQPLACGETTCTQSTAISGCGETTCTQSTAIPVGRGYKFTDFKEALELSLAS